MGGVASREPLGRTDAGYAEIVHDPLPDSPGTAKFGPHWATTPDPSRTARKSLDPEPREDTWPRAVVAPLIAPRVRRIVIASGWTLWSVVFV